MEVALAGADYVQESSPERLDIKIALYQTLDSMIDEKTVIGSSTSGLPASAFTEGLKNRARYLVVHPINPPHLVPLVEIVPAPWTDPDVVHQVNALMRKIGQSPIFLSREINGFLVNRLQSAILAEAFRLVEDGICSVRDIDTAMTDGLGMRWAFMGPFQTIDLNAARGVADYCRALGPMYYGLAMEQADPRPWSADLIKTVESQLRTDVLEQDLPNRRAWRDAYLAALRIFKETRNGS
jgi:3-hydroxyacyl-CoA dehydrogenase